MPSIRCEHCSAALTVPDPLVKPIRTAKCPKCGETVQVAELLAEISDRPVKLSPLADRIPQAESKPASRRSAPPREELDSLDELEFIDEDDYEDRVSRKSRAVRGSSTRLSRSEPRKKKTSGGVIVLIVAGVMAAMVLVGVLGVAVGVLLTRGGRPETVAAQPVAAPPSSGMSSAPSVLPGETSPAQTSPPAANPAASSPAPNPPNKTQPPVVAALPPAASMPVTRYSWKDGDNAVYRFELTAELDNTTNKESGTLDFTVAARDMAPSAPEAPQEGSGTGFVVSSAGHIVTCAHVVAGASQIQVTLSGQKFPASVIRMDEERDLAVIQVNGAATSPMWLGDSDQTAQGSEVHALGFPLSPALGATLKINRGILSGVVLRGNQPQLQVDAPINPGNSGGPIVNSRGEVIGVASSKLADSRISSVGFAVPSNVLRQFLTSAGVTPPASAAKTELSGPQLVTNLSPSIVYVAVTIGASNEKETELRCSVFSRPESPPRIPVRFDFRRSIFNMTSETVTLRVNGMGQVTSYKGGSAQLPYCLGTYGSIPFVTLPRTSSSNWSQELMTSVTEVEESQGPPLPSLLLRRFQPPQGRVIPAYERYSYEFKEARPGALVFNRKYELATTDSDDKPFIRCRGDGNVTFDTTRGTVSSLQFRGTYEANRKSVSVRLPISLDLTLMTPEEVAQLRAQQAEAREKAAEQARINALPPTSEERTKLLQDLTGNDEGKIDPALNKLKGKVPEQPDPEMARAIARHLGYSKTFRAAYSVQALKNWGTPEIIPDLIDCLKSDNSSLNAFLPETLGALKYEQTFQPLMEAMDDRSKRYMAANSLKKIGSVAEDVVLQGLEHKVTDVVREVIDILGEIGTEKSRTELVKFKKKSPKSMEFWVDIALRKIDGRLKAK